MIAKWVDHFNIRIPADRIEDFVPLYRDALGFEVEHLDDYRAGEKGFLSASD